MRLDIADLSDHCPVLSLQTLAVWLCQWPILTGMAIYMYKIWSISLAWSIALHTQSCTCGHVLKERWQEERTGSSSLNFFQVVFTCVVVESSQPPATESMSPRWQKEATTSNLSGPTWTSLCVLPSKGRAVPWHYVQL